MQRHVPRRKCIGPAQRPHGDVLRRPVANAGQFFQRTDGGGHIGTGVQLQAVGRHRLRNAHNRCLTLFDYPQLAQRVAADLRQHGGRGEQPRQFRVGRGNGLAKLVHQALRQRTRCGHGDLLAQHGAYGQLVAVQASRHAQAVALRKTGVQHLVDGLRIGIQIKHRTHPANHQRQNFAQRIAYLQHQLTARGVKLGQQPADVGFRARFNAKSPSCPCTVCMSSYKFSSIDGTLVHERQHRVHVIRWPIPELHGRALPVGGRARPAQLRGVEPVVRHKRRVEPAHAGKAAGQGNLGDGQVGVGQQLLGIQQAARLQILQGRHAKRRLENAAQMAVAHAQFAS